MRRSTYRDSREPAGTTRSPSPLLYLREKPIFWPEDLPNLPPPSKVVVGETTIVIDDSVLVFAPMPLPALEWLMDSIGKWVDADPSDANRNMLFGAIEACERQLHAITQAFRDAPRKALIAKVVVPYLDHLLQGAATVVEFKEDIDLKAANILLNCEPEWGEMSIHVLRFSIKRPTPESRILSEQWAPKLWGWPLERGASRLRIDAWRFQKESPACELIGEVLPRSFDIPLHLTTAVVKCIFDRFVP